MTATNKQKTLTQHPNKPNRRQHKYRVRSVNDRTNPTSLSCYEPFPSFTKSRHPIHIFDHYELSEHILGNPCYMHFRSLW